MPLDNKGANLLLTVNIMNCFSEQNHPTPFEEKKYIVFESSMMKLFSKCSICQSPTELSSFTKGTFLKILKITQKCQLCETPNTWEVNHLSRTYQLEIYYCLLQFCILVLCQRCCKTFYFIPNICTWGFS